MVSIKVYFDGNYVTEIDGEIVRVLRAKDCFQSLQIRLDELIAENKSLSDEVSIMKDDLYKDEEIKRLKNELEYTKKQLRQGFAVSISEWTDITKWKREHEAEKHGIKTDSQRIRAAGSIGSGYEYIFTPTSIGITGVIRCGKCGEEYTFAKLE